MDSELVTVDIHINTNATEEERKHLYVPEEAIISFVGEGFQNNLYQGRVLHECMPRAVYPDVMTVIINIKDIAEGLIAIGTIIHALIKFFKKTKGYQQEVEVYYKKVNTEFSCDLHLNSVSNETEVLREIRKILKDRED